MASLDPKSLTTQIAGLLSRYPGVRVVGAGHVDERAAFRLSIVSPQSVARIAYRCCAVNTGMKVLSSLTPCRYGEPMDDAEVTYVFTVPDCDDDGTSFASPPAPLVRFGLGVVRDLKYLSLIDREQADLLQAEWGGRVV